jgi:hypothetical protein
MYCRRAAEARLCEKGHRGIYAFRSVFYSEKRRESFEKERGSKLLAGRFLICGEGRCKVSGNDLFLLTTGQEVYTRKL